MNSDSEEYSLDSRPTPAQEIPSDIQSLRSSVYRKRPNPFVYNNFTKIDEQYIRCNHCYEQGITLKYSMRKSIFKNPENHLTKVHGLQNKKAIKRRQFLKSILSDEDNSEEENGQDQNKVKYLQKDKDFLFRYFTKISSEKAKCNICAMCGKEELYSIKNSLFAGLRRHLKNVHTLIPIKQMFASQRKKQKQRERQAAEKGYKRIKKALFHYFTKVNENELRCKLCNDSYRQKKFSTKHHIYSNAVSHLQKEHHIQLEKRVNDKQNFLKGRRLVTEGERKVIELVCKDGLSMQILQNQTYFKDSFKTLQLFKPQNVKGTIIKELKREKENIKFDLQRRKRQGQRFCISFSQLNFKRKKWLALSIHFHKEVPLCIGIIKTEPLINPIDLLLQQKLDEYELTFKDVLCFTTTGAQELQELTSALNKKHFSCLTSTLQRIVFESLYNRSQNQEETISPLVMDTLEEDFDQIQFQQAQPQLFKDGEMLNIIQKICKRLKISESIVFEKQKSSNSPHFKRYLRYQWHSMLDMLHRYSALEEKLIRMIENSDPTATLSGKEKIKVAELERSLSAASICILELSSTETNLFVATKKIKELIQQLSKIGGNLSVQMLTSIRQIYSQLNSQDYAALYRYLKPKHSKPNAKQRSQIKNAITQIWENRKFEEEEPAISQNNQKQQVIRKKEVAPAENAFDDQKSEINIKAEVNALHKEQKMMIDERIELMLKSYEMTDKKCQKLQKIEKTIACVPASITFVQKQLLDVERILEAQSSLLSTNSIEAIVMLHMQNRPSTEKQHMLSE